MKRLDHKVNIVPVIAKADTLTHAEVRKMKASIMDQVCTTATIPWIWVILCVTI